MTPKKPLASADSIVVLRAELFNKLVEALHDTQWTFRLTEIVCCAYGCGESSRKDQEEHTARCEFVKLMDELEGAPK